MVEDVVQNPVEHHVEAAACAIAEQLDAEYLAERRIEEVDDRGQRAFNPFFYVLQC